MNKVHSQSVPHTTTQPNTNYTRHLFLETIIKPFTERFPTKQEEYYNYSTLIGIYAEDHNKHGITESRLLDEIIKKAGMHIRRKWNRYKNNVAHTIKDNGSSDSLSTILSTLHTFKHWESFVIGEVSILPDRNELIKKLNNVVAGYNEKPRDTHHRIQTYLQQVKDIIDRLNENKVTAHPIPQIEKSFVTHLYDRVFLTDNAKESCGNNGRLNRKVQTLLSSFKTQNGMDLATFIPRVMNVDTDVLTLHSVRKKEVGHYWQKFKNNCTIFNYKSPEELNRKRPPPKATGGPPTKRPRTETRTCTYGDKCRYYINTGKCRRIHTIAELRTMNQKRNRWNKNGKGKGRNTKKGQYYGKQSNGKSQYNNNSKAPNSQKSNNQGSNTRPCRFGSKCNQWQDGKCNYQHTVSEMVCSYCKKTGHPKSKCYALKDAIRVATNNKTTPRTHYNPYQNPNASVPSAHNLFAQQYPFTSPSTAFPYYPQSLPSPSIIPPISHSIPSTPSVGSGYPVTVNANTLPTLAIHQRINELKNGVRDAKSLQTSYKKELKQLETQVNEGSTTNSYTGFHNGSDPRQT